MSTLSVILPVRDGGKTLARAIDSCLAQTWSDFELLVVSNGSGDDSRAIALSKARADSRVRVLDSPEDEGVAGAMAHGLREARGAFLARMDADDECLPERFAGQREFLITHPEIGVVGSQVRLIDSLGEGMERYVSWVNSLRTPADVARERFVECPAIQPSLMMRREAIARAGGYQVVPWAEDHDLFLRMLEVGVRFGKVEELLFHWHDGPGRLTRSHPAYGEEQVWRLKAHHLARLPSVRDRGVVLCGAGPIGKRLGRLLVDEGVRQHGFFEVHPRRVGQVIGGVPVAGPDEFGRRWREATLLSSVGIPGARARVRGLAQEAGYEEGRDFFAVC